MIRHSATTPGADTARDPSPPAADARERIQDAALRLFARHGFAGTPLRRIADEAGIVQGLIHYHFGGKTSLLHSLFERSLAQVRESLAAAEARCNEEPAAALDRLVRTAFTAVAGDPDFWRLSYQLRMQPDVHQELGGALLVWADEARARIRGILEAARHPDPEASSRALFAAIDGAAQHFVLDPDGYPLDLVAGALVRAFAPAPAGTAGTAGAAGVTNP